MEDSFLNQEEYFASAFSRAWHADEEMILGCAVWWSQQGQLDLGV